MLENMLINSGNEINNDVKTGIKINDKGKFCGTPKGDKQCDPLEKIGWGRCYQKFDNRNLTKCNLKMYPSVFKKDFRLKIHPKYLCDKNVIHECVAANAYLSQREEDNFTDDTFFTGELIRAILSIFARTDINFDQKCVLVAMKVHENLKNFAAKNLDMLGECGTNTKDILLGNKKGGPTNNSNRNGCAMRIALIGIFAYNWFGLCKIVLAAIRGTHYHEHSFDGALSVASITFLDCAGLSQKSKAMFINLVFKNKYTRLFNEYDKEQKEADERRKQGKNLNQPNEKVQKTTREKLHYHNKSHFFDFNMDNLTLQSVHNDRLNYGYAETVLDTVVVALRIICVAGSFYEACVLAKAYGGDSDTLLAIVLAMAAVVFGVPEEIQNQVKDQLKIQTSEELQSYAQLSDDMDKQCSNRYPENTPLEEQLKQTYNTILEIMENEKRDIDTMNKNIGFNEQVDEIIYSNSSPSEFFWDQKPGIFLLYFVLVPIILVGAAFYLLSSELVLVALLTICILDFIAFRVITKAFFSKKEKSVLSKISPAAQKSQSEISIDNINIDNEVTRSDEFKQFIKSIIEDWNFNLDPEKQYDLNQREEFEYESDGKAPEFNKDDYEYYLNTLKEYKSSSEKELKEEETKLKEEELKIETDTNKINKIKRTISEIKRTIPEIQRQIDEVTKSTPQQMYDTYINEEKALYKEINAHNRATAEYKTQKKLEKLKNLTLEKVAQIDDYVTKINRIAEKYCINGRIKFDKKKFLKRQIAEKEQRNIVPEHAKENNLINMNEDQVPQ